MNEALPTARPCALCGTPARGVCPSCGLPALSPLPVGIVGRVAAVKGRGRWIPAIVIAAQSVDRPDIVVLCAGESEPRWVTQDCLTPQRLPGTQAALSPAGAILRCIGPFSQSAGFEDSVLRSIALKQGAESPEAKALLALEAASLGDEITFEALELQEPFKTLARANVLIAQGRVPEPQASDHDHKPSPLMRSVYLLQAGTALRSGAPMADPHPMLRQDPMVRLAAETGAGLVDMPTLREAIPLSSSERKGRVEDLLSRWTSDRSLAVCRDIAPTALVLHGLTRATKGAEMPREVLVGQSPTVVDSLIDKGFIKPSALAQLREAWPDLAAYWGGRLDPATLSDEECRTVGLLAEVARRLVSVDPDADLSQYREDPEVEAVIAARRYLAGDDESLELYRSTRSAEDVESLIDLRELSRGDYRGLPPTHLLEERSLWPTISDSVDEAFLDEAMASGDGNHIREFVAWASLRRGAQQLQLGDWAGVERHCTRALQAANQEFIADEALNVRAIGRWLSGQGTQALDDLEEALKGQYGPGLVANSVVVALADSSPRRGALLARTIDLAPTSQDAGQTAAFIAERLQAGLSEEESLPYELLQAVRATVVRDIRKDDFRSLLQVLSNVDSEWLAGATFKGSPHAKSPEAEVFRAKAEGIFEWVASLVHHRKVKEPWLDDMSRNLSLMLCGQLMQDGSQQLAADLALQLLDGGVSMPPDIRVQLLALATREIAFIRAVAPTLKSTPGWLEDARLKQFLNAGSAISGLDGSAQEMTREVYDMCARAILGTYGSTLQTLAQVLPPLVFGSVAQQFRSIFSSIEKSSSMPIDVKQHAGELRRMLG